MYSKSEQNSRPTAKRLLFSVTSHSRIDLIFFAIGFAFMLLFLLPSSKQSEISQGDNLKGTLIVLVPSLRGVLVCSDRLGRSKTTGFKAVRERKILSAGNGCIIATFNASAIQAIQTDGTRKTIFDAASESQKFLNAKNLDFKREFPAPIAFELAQTLVKTSDFAFAQLPNRTQLIKGIDKTKPMFCVRILNHNLPSKSFEVVEIDILSPTESNRFRVKKSRLESVDAWGMPDAIEAYRNQNPDSDIAKALRAPCPCWHWTENQSRKLAIQMNQITHLKFPQDVGSEMDFLFIDMNGDVSAR